MGFVGKVEIGTDTNPVGSGLYGTCSTAASASAKVASVEGLDTMMEGITVHIQFDDSNTAENPTLDVNGLGSKPICRAKNSPVGNTAATSWMAGSVLTLSYDGTDWIINDWLNTDTNTEYSEATQTTAGLMSASDKAKLDGLNLIVVSNVSVPTSAWSEEKDETYTDYYSAAITVAGVTAGHCPMVSFDPTTANTIRPASFAVTGDGTVTIYARKKPAEAITVGSIQCVKAVV